MQADCKQKSAFVEEEVNTMQADCRHNRASSIGSCSQREKVLSCCTRVWQASLMEVGWCSKWVHLCVMVTEAASVPLGLTR